MKTIEKTNLEKAATQKRETAKALVLTTLLIMLMLALQSCGGDDDPNPDSGIYNYESPLNFDYQNLTEGATITKEEIDYYEGSDLTLTLFEAIENEQENRPLLLLGAGGAWSRYTQVDKLEAMAINFAKRGYVVGIVEYEIGDRSGETWVKGVHDFKTAVRFFKTYKNDYKIDPNNIFTGGWSTGGQLALYAAFMDETDFEEFDQDFLKGELEPAIESMGMDGNKFTEVTSDVKGTVIMMPYIFDVNIIDENEPAICLVAHPNQHFMSGKQIWGEVFDSGVYNYGPDRMKERILEVGYQDQADFQYVILPETFAREGVHVNATPLEAENYEYIINYIYRNLD